MLSFTWYRGPTTECSLSDLPMTRNSSPHRPPIQCGQHSFLVVRNSHTIDMSLLVMSALRPGLSCEVIA